jgi:pyrroline-5-carboxylate reductase
VDNVYQFLESYTLGIFGAGHLGRSVARGLLDCQFRKEKLAICHRESESTREAIVQANLGELLAEPREMVHKSKILLYIVRPQDYFAIGKYDLRHDCILVSFLAGISLARLPIKLPDVQRVRVMPSSPDTLQKRAGIVAVYPEDNPMVNAIFSALGLRLIALHRESDFHAFTALGPCLPIVLTYWEGLGHEIGEPELIELMQKFELPNPSEIIGWVRSVQPSGLSEAERSRYIHQATTPGGITEAILHGIDIGERLSVALERGIRRSQELSTS